MAVLIKWEGERGGVVMQDGNADRAKQAFRKQYPHLPDVCAQPFSGAVDTRWKVKPRPGVKGEPR